MEHQELPLRRFGLALLGLLAFANACGPSTSVDEVRRMQQTGLYAATLEPLRALLAEQTEDPELQYLYGVALARTGSPSLALWPLEAAMQSPEWVVPAGLQLASSALAAGNFDIAVDAASRVLAEQPDSGAALVLRATARNHTRRDYEGALADAERAIELDPDDLEALVPRAVALLALERADEAEVALEDIDRRFQEEGLGVRGSPTYCTARASFAKEKGDAESADRIYGECLERFPTAGVLIRDAVGFYDAQGRFDRSNELLRAAIAEGGPSRPYRIALAARLEAGGDDEAAEQVLREGTETDDVAVAAAAWADLAGFLMAQGQHAAGLRAFERSRELAPAVTPEFEFAHADALVVGGEYERALEVASQMSVPAHRAMIEGRVALLRGEPALALERLTDGLRDWPDNAMGRYLAARAAEEVGDFDRAIEEYRYSIRSDASASDARLRLARLHAAEGEVGRALTALRHDLGGHRGDTEMAILELELLARTGRPPVAAGRAELQSDPESWGRAVAAVAAGARARSGPGAAVAAVRSAEYLDLAEPASAPALRAAVLDLIESGESEEALRLVDASLEARPDAAAFLAIRGDALARLPGDGPTRARAAYEGALEVDDSNAWALAGLGALEREAGRRERALELYARAAEAAADERAVVRVTAALERELGQQTEAARRLELLLEEHPYDAQAALALAELRIAVGAEPDRTRELLRRAARFGAAAEAAQLESQLGAERSASETPSVADS